ncbi:CAP domain-containing protein [Isachenkonia alkalipeptolytica]|uniref:SCP domain-containing protein n=1 Tax=Isachenkonia alkalipeptolytica TaxID=2565777 RepID=A0AA44BEF2_9CLOT|nr:CAP domain-containing protein [Isachenkonia alkalipeptolytica]NBG88903.1 hypothetical protein [Isachenkonia alkalipeptolytica]
MQTESRKSAGGKKSPGGFIIKLLLTLLLVIFISGNFTGCFWIVEAPVEEDPENQESPEGFEEEDPGDESLEPPGESTGENPGGETPRETVEITSPVETGRSRENEELKIPEEPVEVTPVDENFPSEADVLKEETLTSEAVIRYFEDKYGHYGGRFMIQVSVGPDTFEEDGILHHQREAFYTLTRKEDDRVIGKEVFRQVHRKVSLNPSVMDTLDGEYSRVVESNTVLREIEERVIGKLNDARSEQGLGALSTASDLTRLARIKSSDMGLYNYFNHDSPTYGSPFEMASALGVSLRSENIQWATWELTAEEVHTNFMNSPGHRDNRMTEGFREVGIGVIKLENGYYVTELFR